MTSEGRPAVRRPIRSAAIAIYLTSLSVISSQRTAGFEARGDPVALQNDRLAVRHDEAVPDRERAELAEGYPNLFFTGDARRARAPENGDAESVKLFAGDVSGCRTCEKLSDQSAATDPPLKPAK
jgi:hypothetical protein